jgi:hypothetical protein
VREIFHVHDNGRLDYTSGEMMMNFITETIYSIGPFDLVVGHFHKVDQPQGGTEKYTEQFLYFKDNNGLEIQFTLGDYIDSDKLRAVADQMDKDREEIAKVPNYPLC